MVKLDKYVNFLCEHKLTQSQYLFLQLVKEERLDLIKKFKATFNLGIINKIDLQDLIEKGFINKTTTGFRITDKFLDIYVDGEEAVDEIYEIYPSFITSNTGVRIPLIAMDRKVFKEIYLNKIQGDLQEHKEVIKDIKYGVENKLIGVGINKFLTSEMWKSIRSLRIEDNTNTGNNTSTVFDNNF